jgi:hypothetical protein
MATFITTMHFTEQGIKAVRDSCERAAAFKATARQVSAFAPPRRGGGHCCCLTNMVKRLPNLSLLSMSRKAPSRASKTGCEVGLPS